MTPQSPYQRHSTPFMLQHCQDTQAVLSVGGTRDLLRQSVLCKNILERTNDW